MWGESRHSLNLRGAFKAIKETEILIDGKPLAISHPDKLLWPEAGITKLQYIRYLLEAAPLMLPYTKDRMLMTWHYPDGIAGRRVEHRSVQAPAPDWLPRTFYGEKERILLNDRATLVWVANRNACELHVPFDKYDKKGFPTELVLDLDPAGERDFGLVLEVALQVKQVLQSLSLVSFPKTSGATGLQIYVPIEPKYTFEETRRINAFIAAYMNDRMRGRITLDRVVERRGGKLYFDYLQLWKGRTMAAPYSVRARPLATVSAPVSWEEVERGFVPADFTLYSVPARIGRLGDLFAPVSDERHRLRQNLDAVLAFVMKHA